MILQSHSWAYVLEKHMTWKDTYTPMFIAALFTKAKTCKQPKCPSTEEWIKKMWYIYTMEYYSTIKKNEMPFSETLSQNTSWKVICAWKCPHHHHLDDWWGPPDFLLPDGYVAGCGSLLLSLFVLDELSSLVPCLLPPFLKSSSSPQVGMGLMSYHHGLYAQKSLMPWKFSDFCGKLLLEEQV